MDRANELIKKMLYAGWSRAEIAKELGVTKNSIVGRVHRMKQTGQLPDFEDNKPGKPTGKQRIERKKERRRRGIPPIERRAPPKKIKDIPLEWENVDVKVKSGRIKTGHFLCDLPSQSDCRFPVGRFDGQHTFCGNPGLSIKRPYCETHKPMVWIKPTGERPRQKFKQAGFNTFVYGDK